jgi:gluconokinase
MTSHRLSSTPLGGGDVEAPFQTIVVIGVSGSGKTTIGLALAQRTGSAFCDADDLHTVDNIAKMSAGHPLNDEDRFPWLDLVGQRINDLESNHRRVVVACSALKRDYRNILRTYSPNAFVVSLESSRAVVQARVNERRHEFMPRSLLASQYEIFEPLEDDERGMRITDNLSPRDTVSRILVDVKWPDNESHVR